MLAVCIVLIPKMAFAAETTADKTTESLGTLIQYGINFLNVLLWPFLLMIGDLMDSDIIIGPGMEERLLGIWVEVRNIVNVIFVLVMIAIAFYNILGLGNEGNLALKTALPKLIIGIILVNFTFLGGKIIIDISSIATTAVFGLPLELTKTDEFDFNKDVDTFTRSVCNKSYNEQTQEVTHYSKGDKLPIQTNLFCEFGTEEATKDVPTGNLSTIAQNSVFSRLSTNNIGILMATNMGALTTLPYVSSEVTDYKELLLNSIFALVMYVVFAVSYVVLGLLLIFRVVVLWTALALSPILVLTYVVPQFKELGGGGGDVSQKVIKHLIAPIVIGLVMTIGYLMVDALSNVVGGASAAFTATKVDAILKGEFLITGISDLQQIMIAITSVVVVWTGVFAAAQGTYAEGIVGGIKSFSETIAKGVASSPKFLPIIPVRTAAGQPEQMWSPAAFMNVPSRVIEQVQRGETPWQQGLSGFANTEAQTQALMGMIGLEEGQTQKLLRSAAEQTTAENSIKYLRDALNLGIVNADITMVTAAMTNAINRSQMSEQDKKNLVERVQQAGRNRNFEELDTILQNEGPFQGQVGETVQGALRKGTSAAATPPPAAPPTPAPPPADGAPG